MLQMKPVLLSLVALAGQVSAWSQQWKQDYGDVHMDTKGLPRIAGKDTADTAVDVAAVNTTGSGYFKQLIDHNNASAGTFDQYYMYSTEFWGGPGSPVVLFTPGEVNASLYTSYLTVNRTTGVIAQQIGAAVFVVEHRYWGNSSPYTDLTTANMQYLTLENAIADFVYFANNVQPVWATNASTKAKDVPWVVSGGSYSGALSAWTESVSPGTFWAYHASSAPVEAISDYAGYFYPVQQGMAQNCSTDLNLVIDYMDGILNSTNTTAIAELKTMFQMQDVQHNDDFMSALENGPWLWQSNQFYTGYSGFFQFCDFIENARTPSSNETGIVAGAGGVGLQKALQGYADWFTTQLLPDYCYETYGYDDFNGTYNTACFDTYNATSPLFTDTSLANAAGRQWTWLLCNEPFGYWQDGAPANRSTIVSRLVDAKYWIRQCGLYFPAGPQGQTYGIAEGKTEAVTNNYTKGWDTRNATRLVYANGGFDPWRESGVSADIRPGGPLQSTAQTPVNIVPGGFHTSDLVTRNGVVNAGCQAVIDAVVKQIVTWVGEWPKSGSTKSHAKKWVA